MNNHDFPDDKFQADELTWREQEVLVLLADHKTNREIADQLHLDGMRELCVSQQMFYKKFYSWDNRKNEWNQFLQGALHAKS